MMLTPVCMPAAFSLRALLISFFVTMRNVIQSGCIS